MSSNLSPITPPHLPLTGLPQGEVPPAVLVCGDPKRATKISRYLENSRSLSNRREYRAYVGEFERMPVAVCSHGIGAPGAAIAFEELIAAGARQIIRIGTCGALQAAIPTGQLIVATAAVQNSGYGRETVPDGYPAVAGMPLTMALYEAATASGSSVQSGIVLTRDNFYRGVSVANLPDYAVMAQANVLAVEMECAALFIVGSLRQAQTAAILAVDGNLAASGLESMDEYNPHQDAVNAAIDSAIHLALRALRNMHYEP
jgi:uridine phosphorylase